MKSGIVPNLNKNIIEYWDTYVKKGTLSDSKSKGYTH